MRVVECACVRVVEYACVRVMWSVQSGGWHYLGWGTKHFAGIIYCKLSFSICKLKSSVHVLWAASPPGAWGAPPFGTERVRRFTARLAHVATSITASCPANIKHSNLQLSKDSSVAVLQIQRLILKGRGSKK